MTGTPQPDAAAGSGTLKSSPTSLAWLVHSQDSISRSLPPDIDDKPLVRQRRRRTSPEDQKILEAEYQRNPRPDKATRMSIVKRVALGEKEVQIWFQNRRQNTRRKAQPLTADEILNRLNPSSDGPSLASDPVIPTNSSPENNKENAPVISKDKPGITFTIEREPKEEEEDTSSGTVDAKTARPHDAAADTQTTVNASQATTDQPPNSTAPTELSASQVLASSQESVTPSQVKTGYLANRRSASFIHTSEESMATTSISKPIIEGVKLGYLSNRRSASFVLSSGDDNAQPSQDGERSLKRSSSMIRLSMTWDGKAKVIGNSTPSPSPPRTLPPTASFPVMVMPAPSLRRSHSAVGLANNPRTIDLDPVGRKFQRTASGRSRDSRAWEFWCDSDARNSLAEKAEQESSGSAADAIGLMRSNSRTVTAKAAASRKRALQPSAGTNSVPSKRSKFSRATTATGRLPSETRKLAKGKEAMEDSEELDRPYTDSDKENWEPTNSGMQPHRRPQGALSNVNRGHRAVLGENVSVPSQSSSLGAMMDRERRPKLGVEDADNLGQRLDDEVVSFMASSERSSSARTSLSSGEDLDCVQGLLRLSQGIWN